MRFRNFLLLVLTSILIVVCGKKEYKTIKLAAILPLSGTSANIGRWQQQGLDLAMEEVNSTWKNSDKAIQIIYEDSQGEPKFGLSSFEKLITGNEVPVVFISLSSVANAILPRLNQNPINAILLAVSLPKITDQSDFAFRFNLGSDDEATAIAAYFGEKQIQRVAVAYINDEFGIGALEAFNRETTTKNGKVLTTEAYNKEQTDFRTIATKIANKKPDAIYIIGYVRASVMLIRQMRELGVKAPVFGNMALSVPSYIELGGSSLEGAVFTVTRFDVDSIDSTTTAFVNRFHLKYGEKPTFFSAFAYDALIFVAQSLKVENTSVAGLHNYLIKKKEFIGIMGRCEQMPNRAFRFQTQLVKNENGKIVSIQ